MKSEFTLGCRKSKARQYWNKNKSLLFHVQMRDYQLPPLKDKFRQVLLVKFIPVGSSTERI